MMYNVYGAMLNHAVLCCTTAVVVVAQCLMLWSRWVDFGIDGISRDIWLQLFLRRQYGLT